MARWASIAIAVVAFATFLALGSAAPAQAAQLRSFYELTVIVNNQAYPHIDFEFFLDSPFDENSSNTTVAESIEISVTVGNELEIEGTSSSSWTANASHVKGDFTFSGMQTRLSDATLEAMAADPGTTFFTTATVRVVYTDNNGVRPRTIERTLSLTLNYRPPESASLLPAALAGLGGAGAFGLLLFVAGRARIEELYLMHDSGLLIRHWSRTRGQVHDSDIMTGMFVVLQEFVRDSFSDPKGSLEHLRFGRRQVVMTRGQHTILAAVVRGRYLNGLPIRLRQSVTDFEGSYRDVLRTWNGNVGLFPRVDEVARRILRGLRFQAAA